MNCSYYFLLLTTIREHTSSHFAKQRLNHTDQILRALLPEVELLDPEEGSRRLQPLERQVFEYQTKVCFKSLIN